MTPPSNSHSFPKTLTEPFIRLKNVQKSFGSQVILRNVNVDISAGQFVCILGASGCGKSTLLRLLAGLETPDQQQQFWSKTDAKQRSAEHVVNTATSKHAIQFGIDDETLPRLGFVFQHPNLLPWRTVSQNISLPLQLQGTSRSQQRMEVSRALTQVGLTMADGGKWPRMLSGGMQMRASLARAIVTKPKVMLLDEPFSALDEVLRQRLCEELRQWHHEFGWTTLFVTHHVSEAVFLADRILIFRSLADQPELESVAVDIPISLSQRNNELRETKAYVETVVAVSKQFRGVAT